MSVLLYRTCLKELFFVVVNIPYKDLMIYGRIFRLNLLNKSVSDCVNHEH